MDMIGTSKIIAAAFSAVLALGFPVVLLIFWRKKTKAPFVAALVGAAMFLLFSQVLESLLHVLVLRQGGFVMTHTWAYVLYASFAAGIFEETGRLAGFKLLLRKHTGREAGVMYGIGHGGIEAILIGAVSAVANLVFMIRYNAGAYNGAASVANTVQTVMQTPAIMFAMVGVERVLAVCFHIALSVLVFQAANRAGKFWLYPVAILLHAGLDSFAAAYQKGVFTSIVALETVVAVITLAAALFAVRLYRADAPAAPASMQTEKPE
jgi:uncharacterized membrane protein YhfC